MKAKNRILVVLAAACIGALIIGSAAHAAFVGDCNGNETVTIGEVTKCGLIFSDLQPLSSCVNCDRNCNGTVSIGEVTSAGQCFMNSAGPTCPTITCGPTSPTPTATPTVPAPTPTTPAVVPTNTSTPTSVATSTHTAVSTATNTVPPPSTPTSTPVNTPTATNSPPPPSPTPTATTGEETTLVFTLGAGSKAVVQNKLAPITITLTGNFTIRLGSQDANGERTVTIPAALQHIDPVRVPGIGIACVGQAYDAVGVIDCNGGRNEPINFSYENDHNTTPQVCVGGANHGDACSGRCSGGTNNGNPCAVDTECPGTGIPKPACSSTTPDCPNSKCNLNNSGQTCVGGANQGLACTSNANCPGGACKGFPNDPTCTNTQPAGATVDRACMEGLRLCIGGTNNGNTCLFETDCPGGSCATSRCRAGANAGQACLVTDDCPGSTCAGSLLCRGGTNAGLSCAQEADCPGEGVCYPCSSDSRHGPGICNSPTKITQTGTFGAADVVVVVPQSILLLANDNSENGPDGIPCTADDTPPSPPATVPVVLTTGTVMLEIIDQGNARGQRIGPGARTTCTADADCPTGEKCRNKTSGFTCAAGADCWCRVMCGSSPCNTFLPGTPFSGLCSATPTFAGGKLVGGFPAYDTTASDIATVFTYVAQ